MDNPSYHPDGAALDSCRPCRAADAHPAAPLHLRRHPGHKPAGVHVRLAENRLDLNQIDAAKTADRKAEGEKGSKEKTQS